MPNSKILTLLICLFSLTSLANDSSALHNRVIKVKSISGDKKSFITRQGRFDGITEGLKAVFKGKNISFVAMATEVSRFYSLWKITSPQFALPIKKGDYLTSYKGQEYLWTHQEGENLSHQHREAFRKKAHWLSLEPFFLRGLSESISNVSNNVEVSRNGLGLNLQYYREITSRFYWGIGLRFASETIDIRAGTLQTKRIMIPTSIHYMTKELHSFYNGRFMVGLGIGFSTSNTISQTSSQSGYAMMLPSLEARFLFKLTSHWAWSPGFAIEALTTKESINHQTQTTNQLNLRLMISLQRLFGELTTQKLPD